jgi:hypothetical protein
MRLSDWQEWQRDRRLAWILTFGEEARAVDSTSNCSE